MLKKNEFVCYSHCDKEDFFCIREPYATWAFGMQGLSDIRQHYVIMSAGHQHMI
jgi:hypothetical protein